MARVLTGVNQLGALLSVVIVDVVLAGDNATVVGMAAAGLPPQRRRRVIVLGIAAARILRILLAYFAVQLLAIIGMSLAGGVLLLWVSWKMYREFREMRVHEQAAAATTGCCQIQVRIRPEERGPGSHPDCPRRCIDVIASTYIARLLDRHFWISWVALGIITFVALLIWEGSTEVIKQTAPLTLPGLSLGSAGDRIIMRGQPSLRRASH